MTCETKMIFETEMRSEAEITFEIEMRSEAEIIVVKRANPLQGGSTQ